MHAPGSLYESALACHMSSICQASKDFIVLQDSAGLALQVSVLLVGPRGSGRSTAVRAATAALGIHMVPFSCHDLKGQTDSQTATALKASLEAAQEFAPVVLLLRHFEVLSESPQGASQGDPPHRLLSSGRRGTKRVMNPLLDPFEPPIPLLAPSFDQHLCFLYSAFHDLTRSPFEQSTIMSLISFKLEQ